MLSFRSCCCCCWSCICLFCSQTYQYPAWRSFCLKLQLQYACNCCRCYCYHYCYNNVSCQFVVVVALASLRFVSTPAQSSARVFALWLPSLSCLCLCWFFLYFLFSYNFFFFALNSFCLVILIFIFLFRIFFFCNCSFYFLPLLCVSSFVVVKSPGSIWCTKSKQAHIYTLVCVCVCGSHIYIKKYVYKKHNEFRNLSPFAEYFGELLFLCKIDCLLIFSLSVVFIVIVGFCFYTCAFNCKI